MSVNLSGGALESIMAGGDYEFPVLQVLSAKMVGKPNAQQRYRLMISDGKHYSSLALLASQLNEMVINGDISEFSVIKIKKHSTTIYRMHEGDKRVMLILELDVIRKGNEVGLRIGDPKPIEDAISSNSNSSNSAQSNLSKPTLRPSAPQSAVGSNVAQMKVPQGTAPIHPISSLNPYQNKWSIKARVTNKMAPRTYTNARGEGKLFSVVFTDESGEIKCTGFNNAVDKFSDLLQLDKVYIVSNCSVKPANKKFTQADYEMTFNDDSIIVPCADDVGLPKNVYNFVPIPKIAEMDVDSIVDVIGVAKTASEIQTLIAKSTGKELKKREVVLVDNSNSGISLTLWGTEAVDFDTSRMPVVAAKGVRVSEFMGGKSLSLLMSSSMQIDPDIPEAYRLRGWFDSVGSGQEFVSLSAKPTSGGGGSSNWVRLGELTSKGIGLGDKADYFSGVVNVLMVRSDNCVYKACPGNDCKKKVMDMNNGQFRCEKCNRDYDHFLYRMLLSVQVSDFTGSMWVTLFHEEAQKLLGASAKEIGEAIDQKDESYKELFTNMNFKKFQMKFRTKMESYNDEKRLKTTVVSVDPVDYVSYTKKLLSDFKENAGMVSKLN